MLYCLDVIIRFWIGCLLWDIFFVLVTILLVFLRKCAEDEGKMTNNTLFGTKMCKMRVSSKDEDLLTWSQ